MVGVCMGPWTPKCGQGMLDPRRGGLARSLTQEPIWVTETSVYLPDE